MPFFGFGIVLHTFLVHSLVKNALCSHWLLNIMRSLLTILTGQLFLSLFPYILSVPELVLLVQVGLFDCVVSFGHSWLLSGYCVSQLGYRVSVTCTSECSESLLPHQSVSVTSLR